jgi:hypothetical protein
MKILSFDPGLTNFAVWCGNVDTDAAGKIVPVTYRIDKFDIKQEKKAVYEAVADTVLANSWMTEPGVHAVVETQAMQNIPARIVATTIYGVLRGRGIPVCFSGAKIKNDAIDLIAEQYSIEVESKPSKQDIPECKARLRQMHKINKSNSKTIVSRLLQQIGDTATAEKISNARDAAGKLKADDLTDAILLGIGLYVRDLPKKRTRSTTKLI